jgi:hypothetical protein
LGEEASTERIRELRPAPSAGARAARAGIAAAALTLGALDAVDDNSYAHDPRSQFLNWALMTNGAWDFPADTRGTTYGGTIELFGKDGAVRYGLFAMAEEANGIAFDRVPLRGSGSIVGLRVHAEI